MAYSMWILIKIVCKYFVKISPQQSSPDITELCYYYDAVIIPIDRFALIDISSQPKVVLFVLYLIIICISGFINFATIVLILLTKSLRSAHGVLVISVAFSNLLLTGKLFLSPPSIS